MLQRPAVGAIILGAQYCLLHVHLLPFQTMKMSAEARRRAKVASCWVLQRSAISAVIPGAHLKEAVF